MTVKQLFKKMEEANQFANVLKENEFYIMFFDKDNWQKDFTNYKEFSQYLRKEYFDQVVDYILNYEFDFNSRSIVIKADIANKYLPINIHHLDFELYVETRK